MVLSINPAQKYMIVPLDYRFVSDVSSISALPFRFEPLEPCVSLTAGGDRSVELARN